MSSLRGPRSTDPKPQPCLSHPQGASCCFAGILSLRPESYQAPRQQPGWALSPGATTSLQGRQEVWGREAPSRIHKTNSQNQIQRSGGGRRKGPHSSSGEAKNVLSVARKSLWGRPYRLTQGNGTPEWTSPSPHSETGRVRFGILGPRG